MEKVNSEENKVIIEGIYTIYGGEPVKATISMGGKMELLINENGEMNYFFRANVLNFWLGFYYLFENKKSNIIGENTFYEQTENSEITLEFSKNEENVILKSKIVCKSIIFSKKTAKQIFEEITDIILKKY